ncbi:MAG: hypothetical protein LQ347_003864 [Umbilicaria vellea]|nr:MAG: hypothetical protein LQ347_003864 [Umbilicaria vellea]
MSDQFVNVAPIYQQVLSLPDAPLEYYRLRNAVGDLKGLNVLDLACGIGNSTQHLLDWGAARVVGVDISEAMLAQTRKIVTSSKATFVRADCSSPTPLKLADGPFDIVHAAWLLDYAADRQQMAAMWRMIAINLKPRGRFIGMVPNPDFDFEDPSSKQYGASYVRCEAVEDGYRMLCTAYTDPPLSAYAYLLNRDVYSSCAYAAGMREFQFDDVDVPEDVPGSGTDYWDTYLRNPRTAVCRAIRQGSMQPVAKTATPRYEAPLLRRSQRKKDFKSKMHNQVSLVRQIPGKSVAKARSQGIQTSKSLNDVKQAFGKQRARTRKLALKRT